MKKIIQPFNLLTGIASIVACALSSCSFIPFSLVYQKNPIAIVLLKDTSVSGQNNEEFQTTTKKACKGITESISRGDNFKVIHVNGEQDFFENLTPTNPTEATKQCGSVSTTQKKGTLTCPAIRTAHKIFQSSKNPGVLLVLIETNEGESPCPEDWRTTVKNVIDKTMFFFEIMLVLYIFYNS